MSDRDGYLPGPTELAHALRGLEPADRVLVLEQHLRLGDFSQVIAIAKVSETDLPSAAVELCAASAWLGLGDVERARQICEQVTLRHPGHLPALAFRAQLEQKLGERELALSTLQALVRRYPDYPGALATLSRWLFPGPHYREVLARIHRLLNPRTYLEIGVDTGATLRLAAASCLAVGVDPEPVVAAELGPYARVVPLPSDEFFARHSRHQVFGDAPLDLVFIDGLHRFEQVLRDFCHAEAWCHAETTLLLHDCLPPAPVAAETERRAKFWVGDGWKLLEILTEERPQLAIRMIPCPPSGLVVVRGLDPDVPRLRSRAHEYESRYRDLAYPYLPGRCSPKVEMVSNDEAGLRRALAPNEATKYPSP